MKSSSSAEIGKQKTALGGVVKVDPNRRLIDLTVGELYEINFALCEEISEGKPKASDDGAVDRGGAAEFLSVSTAQVDKLCREQGLPYHRVGDVKRFFRDELRAWVKAQGSK